ncbi:DUF4190 domain-containing protein [Streptomyces griseomycini]|uniref:DUF4190 domain-containing protein n=1 Tax=Streptomyces griseomycini TaxID=66895 RepID=A0A7W7LZA9_9ACTN|nr:DUF4190 domain-containing protein [Streptomyces griseomycini]MBB4899245.1 hypothetical protein [Streptomyces griseomycini]GGQ28487.1 hypothetical protein GCM10010266_59790 [Streptomyces griseomycini]GGR35033.1 hypothetical protein GCM10015536_45730 [Streptomyces griseomycini]
MASYGSSSVESSGSRTNGLAIASLCCGVVGLFVLNIVLGPLAIIFGAIARRQAAVKNGAGMAKAGIILGIVDVVLWLVLLAVAASNDGFSWYVGG